MNVQYTLAPKREPGLDSDEIITLLGECQAKSRPVKSMNYYRELPITTVSPLSRVNYGTFEISVSGIHLQVIGEQRQTILSIDLCTVLAECSSVNYQKKRLAISGFRFIELHAAQRGAFRLNVDADLIVDFRTRQGKIAARMVDISMTGCRITFDSDSVAIGKLVVVEIRIFDQNENKESVRSIAARVVTVYTKDSSNYCCLEFIGTPSEQDLLVRYLNQQQTALIREFHEKSTAA